MAPFSLIKRNRILKRSEFLRIGGQGGKLKTRHFIVLYSKNDLAIRRFGITASKKIGNAVKRNRVKRVLREFFRLNQDHFSQSTDFIFIAGRGSYLLSCNEVRDELLKAFKSKGIFREEYERTA